MVTNKLNCKIVFQQFVYHFLFRFSVLKKKKKKKKNSVCFFFKLFEFFFLGFEKANCKRRRQQEDKLLKPNSNDVCYLLHCFFFQMIWLLLHLFPTSQQKQETISLLSSFFSFLSSQRMFCSFLKIVLCVCILSFTFSLRFLAFPFAVV